MSCLNLSVDTQKFQSKGLFLADLINTKFLNSELFTNSNRARGKSENQERIGTFETPSWLSAALAKPINHTIARHLF